MDLTNLLSELRAEVDRLNEAIVVIERLVSAGGKRRGRPPKWLVAKRLTEMPNHSAAASERAARASEE
jgi:hypothetical protein